MSADKEITELVYQSCFLLDEMNFSGYLDLCAPEFRYKIVAYSPELRKDMVWQDVDREELEHHFSLIPRHVREMVSLSRFPTLYTIRYDGDGKRANVLSGLQVFKTRSTAARPSSTACAACTTSSTSATLARCC